MKTFLCITTFLWICCVLPLASSLVPPAGPTLVQEKLGRSSTSNTWRRRDALVVFFGGTAAMVGGSLPAIAVDSSSSGSSLTLQGLLSQLRSVPTFCIVSPEGASYMLIKSGEAFAKGYAFTTFSGALAVLGDAERAAEKGGYADTWKGASITVIPADIAVRLALQPTKRTSQKDQTLNTMLDVIPGVDDRDDALKLDRKFSDQGKVPLFYFDELRRPDGSIPVYFKKDDLTSEWNKQNLGDSLPKMKVLDLVTVFQYVLRGKGNELPIKSNIVFVPNPDAVEASKELKARGLAPYKPDRMIV